MRGRRGVSRQLVAAELPRPSSGNPCMYVGVTSCDPRVRFKQHKDGYKSSRVAKKYGKYLMWKKFRHLNPVVVQEAVERERALAIGLRERGYGVWQN